MATVFSELIFYYNGNSAVDIRRSYTDSESRNTINTIVGTFPIKPEAASAAELEMRVVPTGDTTNITVNTFSAWRGLENGSGFVTHRLAKDDASFSTITGTVTLAVEVRRKSLNSDKVTGNIVFDNTLTTSTNVGGVGGTGNTLTYDSHYFGADFNQGTASLSLIKNSGDTLSVISTVSGDVTNTQNTIAVLTWAPTPGAAVANYNVQITEDSYTETIEPIGHTKDVYYTSAMTLPSVGTFAFLSTAAGSSGFNSAILTFTVRITEKVGGALVYEQSFSFTTSSSY